MENAFSCGRRGTAIAVDEEIKELLRGCGSAGKSQNDEKAKAPSGRELSPQVTEGDCVI